MICIYNQLIETLQQHLHCITKLYKYTHGKNKCQQLTTNTHTYKHTHIYNTSRGTLLIKSTIIKKHTPPSYPPCYHLHTQSTNPPTCHPTPPCNNTPNPPIKPPPLPRPPSHNISGPLDLEKDVCCRCVDVTVAAVLMLLLY